jgi:hypothetical protein
MVFKFTFAVLFRSLLGIAFATVMNWKAAYKYGLVAPLDPEDADTPPMLLKTVTVTSPNPPFTTSSFPYYIAYETDDHIRVYEKATLNILHVYNCASRFRKTSKSNSIEDVTVDPSCSSRVAILLQDSSVIILDISKDQEEFRWPPSPLLETVIHMNLQHGFLILFTKSGDNATQKRRRWTVYMKNPSTADWELIGTQELPGRQLFNLGRIPLIFVPLPERHKAMVVIHFWTDEMLARSNFSESTVFHSAYILSPQGISDEKFRIFDRIDSADVCPGDGTIRLWRFTRNNVKLMYSVVTFAGKLIYQVSWNCMNCDVHVKQRTSHGLFMTSKFASILVTPESPRIHSIRRAPSPNGQMSRVHRSISLPRKKAIIHLANVAPGRFVAMSHVDDAPEDGESIELRLYRF